jgi:hypothetical protein
MVRFSFQIDQSQMSPLLVRTSIVDLILDRAEVDFTDHHHRSDLITAAMPPGGR